MTQVIHLVIDNQKSREARNLTMAIINLAKGRNLTPEQCQERLVAIGIIAQEALDVIAERDSRTDKGTKSRKGG